MRERNIDLLPVFEKLENKITRKTLPENIKLGINFPITKNLQKRFASFE